MLQVPKRYIFVILIPGLLLIQMGEKHILNTHNPVQILINISQVGICWQIFHIVMV